MSYVDDLRNGFSIDAVRVDLLKTAYENEGSFLHQLDPRILLIWYVLYLFIPWLFYDLAILSALFVFVAVLAYLSRVSIYLVGLMAFSVVTSLLSYVVVTAFTGDPVAAFTALLPFTMKLTIISVASLTVFSSMSPRTLAQGLLSLRVPRQFTFAITYGYRMLPVLFQEYHELVQAHRLRSSPPDSPGRFKWRHYAYLMKVSMKAFYPMIFNVAKRSRVTVEAMETRGFTHSLGSEESRELQLEGMAIRWPDIAFLIGSLSYVVLVAMLL